MPTWKAKKGGVGPCPGYPSLQTRIDCRYHRHGLIAGTLYCWSCGKAYTEAEKKTIATEQQNQVTPNIAILV